ncbi:23384_t:CDS:2, partial [Gigaspora margarita]
LRLSIDDFVYKLDPLKINFTLTTISPWFKDYNGYNIEKTTKDLVSADNRRLYCLKKAVKNDAKFNKVPVKIIREIDKKAG